MTTCIIAEKPSVARDIARIVGATSKQDGYMEGCGYVVTWAMGHLIALAMPEAYGFSAYKAEDLPIRPNPFQLVVRQVRKDKEYVSDPAALKQLKVIHSCFDKADRIIVATDAGREGELIFRYIYQHLNCHKPFAACGFPPSPIRLFVRDFPISNLETVTTISIILPRQGAKPTGSWVSMLAVPCPLLVREAILWDGYRPQHLLWSAVGT